MNHLSICRLILIVPVVVLCRAQVVTQNATVQMNKPASLRCTLQSSHEVLSVTWQKIKQSIPENMVTYSKNHGVVLLSPYKDKVNITQLELTNSTITFWNITHEDDGILLVLISILYWKCHRHQEVGPEILALSFNEA
nr:CD200-like protein [Betacoronavirus Erinaceus]QRN68116.1 CD200-like protein [Betacoronavirus Erinaceus]